MNDTWITVILILAAVGNAVMAPINYHSKDPWKLNMIMAIVLTGLAIIHVVTR